MTPLQRQARRLSRWLGAWAMLGLPGSPCLAGAGLFAWAAALGLREARQGAGFVLAAWAIVAALVAAAFVSYKGIRLRWVLRAAPGMVPGRGSAATDGAAV